MSRSEASTFAGGATLTDDAASLTTLGRAATKAAVVKTFRDLGESIPTAKLSEINNFSTDTLDNFGKLKLSEMKSVAQMEAGKIDNLGKVAARGELVGAGAVALSDIGDMSSEYVGDLATDRDKFDSFKDLVKDQGLDFKKALNIDPDEVKGTLEFVRDEGGSLEEILSQIESGEKFVKPEAMLKDTNGRVIVVKIGDKFHYAKDLNGVEFFLVNDSHGEDEPPMIEKITFTADKIISADISGYDDGRTETETYTVGNAGVLKATSTNGEVSYYKILQDAAGNFVGVGLEFGDVSDSRHGEFDQKLVDNLTAATKLSDLDPQIYREVTDVAYLFGDQTTATAKFNVFDSGYTPPTVADLNLKNNANAALTGPEWTDSKKQELQTYINGLATDEASKNAVAASVELLEWLLTPRIIQNSQNLGTDVAYTRNGGFENPEDVKWQLPQISNLLKILTKMHAIGDSQPDNKQKIQNFLNNLTTSPEISNYLDQTKTDNTQDFANLLNNLLADTGVVRGRVDDEQNDRVADIAKIVDLDGDNKGKTLKAHDVKIRALPGHTVTFGTNAQENVVLNDSDEHPEVVDVTTILSTRDTIIKGDLTINAPESAKEDAYVIAAADDLYLRGEYNPGNSDLYNSNAQPIDIEVKNASLALASVDSMYLVDVDITTGGSLAVASLDELHLWSNDPSGNPNEFKVGADNDQDFEGLFLYAQDLININGLNVQGRVDDVYMEAYTINLENVTFPSSSAVLMRTELGGLNILNDGGSFGLGDVNLDNVKHLGVKNSALVNADFSTNPSGAHQTILNSSGRPYMKVESYK